MTDSENGPNVPGTPTVEEHVDMILDPDQAVPGLLIVDGEDLPPDEELGRRVRVKVTTDGVEKETLAQQIVIADKSRADALPDILTDETGQERREWIASLDNDVWINLLRAGEDAEFGELIRERLMEHQDVFHPDSDGPVEGHYDPETEEPVYGENRAYVVVCGS